MSKTTQTYSPVKTPETGDAVIVMGSFVPAGTGTTAPTGVRGKGFTVTQTASGVFLVALKDVFKETVSFVVTVDVAGETTDATSQAGDVTVATGAVGEKRVIRTMTAGTPTNFSADSAPRVHFMWGVRRR